MFVRLDRYFGNAAWQIAFPNAKTEAIDSYGSDHKAVRCLFEGDLEKTKSKGRQRFHFEEKWFLDKRFVPNFIYEWKSNAGYDGLPSRMEQCVNFLQRWAVKNFDNMEKQIQRMRKERIKMMEDTEGKVKATNILELSKKIELEVETKVQHWKQRARVNWLANGDRNTRAFHVQASKRRKRNMTTKLLIKLGRWVDDENEMADVVRRLRTYFGLVGRQPKLLIVWST